MNQKLIRFFFSFAFSLFYWHILNKIPSPQVKAYRFFNRPDNKVFPYELQPPPSIIDNGDNDGRLIQDYIGRNRLQSQIQNCVQNWQKDGKCNQVNNNYACEFDGGDCCKQSCKFNCKEIDAQGNDITNITFKEVRKQARPCMFECGISSYWCLQPNQGCFGCNLSNALCLSQDQCFNSKFEPTPFAAVKYMLDSCQALDWTMGNNRTINQYCGLDPYFTVIHDVNDKRLHFPGCGMFPDQCTMRPCCVDASMNGYNSSTCTNIIETKVFYDPVKFLYANKSTNCLDHFYQCFTDNYKQKGQCCQCNKGWAGSDCNQAICYPDLRVKKVPMCKYGVCYGPDLCDCQTGWKGDQCDLAICTNCVNGFCTYPETCDCFYGWTGVNCTQAVSYPSCLNGVALKPDFCQCDEGWEGRVCDIPTCTYGCGNGNCIDSQVCECKPGWYSTSVETPCNSKHCSEAHPRCRYCSQDFPFDCKECEPNHALKQRFNNENIPIGWICIRCDLQYPHCFECNSTQCLQCQWPYYVDEETKNCVSYGITELSQEKIVVDESLPYFDIRINRNYFSFLNNFTRSGYDIANMSIISKEYWVNHTTIEIQYDLSPAYTPFKNQETRIEKKRGRLVFNQTDQELFVRFRIYKRPYYELNFELCRFYFTLTTTQHGGILNHKAKKMIIEYYDGDPLTTEMNDAFWSFGLHYSSNDTNATGITNLVQSINQINKFYYFIFQSYYAQNLPKIATTTPQDTFFVRLILLDKDNNPFGQQDRPFSSYFLKGNQYRVGYHQKNMNAKQARVYASSKGFRIKYFTTIEINEKEPQLERIEYTMPTFLDQQWKSMTFFSMQVDFILRLRANVSQVGGIATQPVILSLALNSAARARLYIDEVLFYETAENTRSVKSINCPPNSTFIQIDPEGSGQNVTTGCCYGKNLEYLINVTVPILLTDGKDSQNYINDSLNYIRIEYTHEDSNVLIQYKQQPCIKLFRSTSPVIYAPQNGIPKQITLLPFQEVTNEEAFALTELRDSFFNISTMIDPSLLDISRVLITGSTFQDENTGIIYDCLKDRTFQVNQTHVFSFQLYDLYGNNLTSELNITPPFQIKFIDFRNQTVFYTNQSYYNYLKKQIEFSITLTKTILNDSAGIQLFNYGIIQITWQGQDISGTPINYYKVLPASYNLSLSHIFQNNLWSSYSYIANLTKRPRCYVEETCTFQLHLNDSFYNPLRYQGKILLFEYVSISVIGPYQNIDKFPAKYIYFRNISQFYQQTNPDIYHFNIKVSKVGEYNIYITLKKSDKNIQKVLTYPIKILTFSDIANSTYSIVLPTYKYVSTTKVQIVAKDLNNNTLTDNGCKIKVKMIFLELGTSNDQQLDLSYVKNLTFSDQIQPGDYVVYGLQSTFVDFGNSTYQIYLNPTRRGYYALIAHICELRENICNLIDYNGYGLIKGTPKLAYLATQFVSPKFSTAQGTGLYQFVISKYSFFQVQLYDKFSNKFDVLDDTIHQTVSRDKFVICFFNVNVPVSLVSVDLFNGLYNFRYLVREPLPPPIILTIRVVDAENYYTEMQKALQDGSFTGDIDKLIYDPAVHYTNINGSPFSLTTSSTSTALLESYQDIINGGLSMMNGTNITYWPTDKRINSISPFTVDIFTKNVFQLSFVQLTVDVRQTLPSEVILVDFFNYEDQGKCIQGSSLSNLRKYCSFFSYSHLECVKNRMCFWNNEEPDNNLNDGIISNILPNPPANACQPCYQLQNTKFADSPQDVKKIEIRYNSIEFFVDTQIVRAGSYGILGAVMQLGSLRATIYKQPDFKEYDSEFRIAEDLFQEGSGGLNLTFESSVSSFFTNNPVLYSIVIQGAIRFDNTSQYNLTFQTNLDMKVYFEGALVLKKDGVQNATVSLENFQVQKDKLYMIEIRLSDDQYYPEKILYLNQTRKNQNKDDFVQKWNPGYLKVWEEAKENPRRIIMPKNLFQITPMSNSGKQMIVINEDIAKTNMTKVLTNFTNRIASFSKPQEPFYRAGETMMVNVTIYDQFNNLRNQSKFSQTDQIQVQVFLLRISSPSTQETILANSLTMIPQLANEGKGYYSKFLLEEKSQNYFIRIYVNGDEYLNQRISNQNDFFNFTVQSAYLDVSQSPVNFLDTNFWPQSLDCVFVNQVFYLIVQMKDKWQNTVNITDQVAWRDSFYFQIGSDSIFTDELCIPYTGLERVPQWYFYQDNLSRWKSLPSSMTIIDQNLTSLQNTIICPIMPEVQSYAQDISGYDSKQTKTFPNFPIKSLQVKPFLLQQIDENQISQFQLEYFDSVIPFALSMQSPPPSQRVSQILIRITLLDIYGNQIGLNNNELGNLRICNQFQHQRLIIYTWIQLKKSIDPIYWDGSSLPQPGPQLTTYDRLQYQNFVQQSLQNQQQIPLDTPVLETTIEFTQQINFRDFKKNYQLSFVVLEGLQFENGFEIKFYYFYIQPNNETDPVLYKQWLKRNTSPLMIQHIQNMIFSTESQNQLIFNDGTDWWQQAWNFQNFTMKATALICVPILDNQLGTSLYQYEFRINPTPSQILQAINQNQPIPKYLHQQNSRIDIFIDDLLILANGTESGIFIMQKSDSRWYKFQLEYTVYDNRIPGTIPSFQVEYRPSWVSQSSWQVLNKANAIAVDISNKTATLGIKIYQNDYF